MHPVSCAVQLNLDKTDLIPFYRRAALVINLTLKWQIISFAWWNRVCCNLIVKPRAGIVRPVWHLSFMNNLWLARIRPRMTILKIIKVRSMAEVTNGMNANSLKTKENIQIRRWTIEFWQVPKLINQTKNKIWTD